VALLPACEDGAPAPAVERYLTHYCVGRLDVPVGDLCAQLIHAAGESSPGNLPSDTRAVALGARSEFELLKLEQKLKKKNIQHVAIREPDAPYFGALMAIGLVPSVRTKAIKSVLGHLPLIGKGSF
jgi:hypothetical protein